MQPWWRVLRIRPQPMPTSRALAIALFIAGTVTTGPKAWSASISRIAGVSFSIRTFGRGRTYPLSTQSMYASTSCTPCESTPRMLLHTSTSASSAASASGIPRAVKIRVANSRSRPSSIRTSLMFVCRPLMFPLLVVADFFRLSGVPPAFPGFPRESPMPKASVSAAAPGRRFPISVRRKGDQPPFVDPFV